MAPMVPLVHPRPSPWSPMERAKTKPSVFLIASCRSRKGSVFFPSAHRWWTASPARFEHRGPGFDGVVTQHPSPGMRHRRIRRNPVVGAHRHPLGMNGGCIWLELHHHLLLCAHQPAFSAGLFWWFVGGAETGQGVGRRQTEDSSAKHLLSRRRPGVTGANSLLER